MTCKIFTAAALAALALAITALAHDQAAPPANEKSPAMVHSTPGRNSWNAGAEPQDWYAEIKRQHGHVGPWNVLGWRIAKAAMRELKTKWGSHELEVVCYVPLRTPYTCLVDGLAVGTGNSMGRLDLRLVEVLAWQQSFVAVRRADGKGQVLEFRLSIPYLKSIANQPVEKLETLSKECITQRENNLFTIKRITAD